MMANVFWSVLCPSQDYTVLLTSLLHVCFVGSALEAEEMSATSVIALSGVRCCSYLVPTGLQQ